MGSCGSDFCFHFGLGQGGLVLCGQTVGGGEQFIYAGSLQFGAQHALDSAKGIVSQAHLDEVGARAAAAASDLYQQGRDRLASSEELSQATEQLSAAIRKNPLAAVGIAFTAGLVVALLTRN